MVKYSGDYTRAEIKNVEDDVVSVDLVDFGGETKVPISNVRHISPNMLSYERMVLPVKLDLPEKLSVTEISAVNDYIKKFKHNRFKIVAKSPYIGPNQIVDLIHIQSGGSMTAELMNGIIEKRYFMKDISRKRVNAVNVGLFIIENRNLSKRYITCVLQEDRPTFLSRVRDLTSFGSMVMNAEAYLPSKFELCLALVPDDDGTHMWYRCQYQQPLANNFAQIGLIDFGVSATVEMKNIRQWESRFGYECLALLCKLRNEEVSFDLLNQDLFGEYLEVDAVKIRPAADFHEVYISNTYFVMEDNFEEEQLELEDFLDV